MVCFAGERSNREKDGSFLFSSGFAAVAVGEEVMAENTLNPARQES